MSNLGFYKALDKYGLLGKISMDELDRSIGTSNKIMKPSRYNHLSSEASVLDKIDRLFRANDRKPNSTGQEITDAQISTDLPNG